MKKLLFGLGTFALAVASAGSYNLTLLDPASVGDAKLKAGAYKVEVVGDKAVFKMGKEVVEVPATIEKADSKFKYTSVDLADSKLKEIRLGGTDTKIVFKSGGGQSADK